jgi:hypothetical protein
VTYFIDYYLKCCTEGGDLKIKSSGRTVEKVPKQILG